MMTIREFAQTVNPEYKSDLNYVADMYAEYFKDNVSVGDGVTVHLYTDANAYTVIARTAKTLTLRRDKAKLKKSFKPIFIPGGFFGTVINQEEQEYEYEPDEEGRIVKAYWSNRKHGFYVEQCLYVSYGRHEFYDYNF